MGPFPKIGFRRQGNGNHFMFSIHETFQFLTEHFVINLMPQSMFSRCQITQMKVGQNGLHDLLFNLQIIGEVYFYRADNVG